MTGIEWCDRTWNPTTGCDRISPGCDNCYALTMAARLKAMGSPKYQRDGHPDTSGPGFGLTIHPDTLLTPLGWKQPAKVFVNSMSDLFHSDVPDDFILAVWETMSRCPQHTFQILTKRPHRAARLISTFTNKGERSPLANVWIGASIETDKWVFRRGHLMAVPAQVRFLSLEPLIGPLPTLNLAGIGWVIVGGESGPSARPMHPAWVRDIRDRCVAAGVPFLFKQWGAWGPYDGRKLSPGLLRRVDVDGTVTLPGTGDIADRDVWLMMRIGKGAAGRTLDGDMWDQYPRAM